MQTLNWFAGLSTPEQVGVLTTIYAITAAQVLICTGRRYIASTIIATEFVIAYVLSYYAESLHINYFLLSAVTYLISVYLLITLTRSNALPLLYSLAFVFAAGVWANYMLYTYNMPSTRLFYDNWEVVMYMVIALILVAGGYDGFTGGKSARLRIGRVRRVSDWVLFNMASGKRIYTWAMAKAKG